MVSRRTNFGERSEPAPDRGGKLQSAGGAAQSNVSPLVPRQMQAQSSSKVTTNQPASFEGTKFLYLQSMRPSVLTLFYDQIHQ